MILVGGGQLQLAWPYHMKSRLVHPADTANVSIHPGDINHFNTGGTDVLYMHSAMLDAANLRFMDPTFLKGVEHDKLKRSL